MIYHIQNNTIIAGPFSVSDPYVRKVTRCGTPETLDLSEYGFVPEVKPAISEHQSYGEPIVTADAVTFPITDWTAEQIAAHEAQALADWRETAVCSKADGQLVLDADGSLDLVEEWIATQPRSVQIEYESRTVWRRNWPLIETARVAMGWTHEKVDALFQLAQAL